MWNFHIMTWVMNHYSIQDEEKSSACLGRSHFPVRTTCLYEILENLPRELIGVLIPSIKAYNHILDLYPWYQIIKPIRHLGIPLQYSCLENPMDRGAWCAAVHEVAKCRTRLSDFTFTFHFHAMEKEMATHSSVLAWRIPGTEEPGGEAVYEVAQNQIRLKRLSSSSISLWPIKHTLLLWGLYSSGEPNSSELGCLT